MILVPYLTLNNFTSDPNSDEVGPDGFRGQYATEMTQNPGQHSVFHQVMGQPDTVGSNFIELLSSQIC